MHPPPPSTEIEKSLLLQIGSRTFLKDNSYLPLEFRRKHNENQKIVK